MQVILLRGVAGTVAHVSSLFVSFRRVLPESWLCARVGVDGVDQRGGAGVGLVDGESRSIRVAAIPVNVPPPTASVATTRLVEASMMVRSG